MILILLAIVTVLALWPVCTAEFTSWDDPEAIAKNPTMLPPTWHSLEVWWTQPTADLWIPITYTTWGVLALIARAPGDVGPNPYVFHAANLLLHVLAVLVVFELLELLLGKRWAAAGGAALFALHPVQVEPVAWAAGMKDVLYGLLALVAIWQYLLAVGSSDERGNRLHYLAATIAYGLALLSKPTAITVPIIAAALELAAEPRMHMRGIDSATWRRWRGMALRLGLWIAMAVPITLIAHRVQPVARAIEIVPLWQRPMVALDAIAFYIGKILWPIGLCIDYGRVPWKIFATGQAYWTWIVPVAIAGALLVWGRRRRMLLAGAGVFVVGLLPVLGLVGFDFQGISTVADHYLYVPMFGAALMAGSLLASVDVHRHGRWAIGGVAIVLALLAIRSFLLTFSWHDSDVLFHHVLAVNPQSSVANESLSDMAAAAGDYPKAIAYAKASIQGNPRRPHGWAKLAAVYTATGDPKRALAAMTRAYEMDPQEPQVLIDLGVKLAYDGQLPAAADRFRQALRIDPNSASAELSLGVDLFQMGRAGEGFTHVQRAVALAPDNPQVQLVLGDFLREMGRLSEAKSAYESALKLKPGYPEAIHGLRQLAAAAATRDAR